MFKSNKSKFLILLVLLSLLVALAASRRGRRRLHQVRCELYGQARRHADLRRQQVRPGCQDHRESQQAGQALHHLSWVKSCASRTTRTRTPPRSTISTPKSLQLTSPPVAAGITWSSTPSPIPRPPCSCEPARLPPPPPATPSSACSRCVPSKSYKFELPDKLRNTRNLRVCLKDRTTSYLQCVTLP